MERSSAFKVQFSGLKLGIHHFEFDVDDAFFEKLDYSPISKGEVEVTVVLDKKSTMMVLDFELNGWVMESCDRCTADYRQHVSGEHQIYVKFGDDFDEPDDSLLVIPRDEFELDISQLIYEFIQLNVPLRKIPCEESENDSMCDKDTLKVLESTEVDEKKNNPLWAELNKIKDQLKD